MVYLSFQRENCHMWNLWLLSSIGILRQTEGERNVVSQEEGKLFLSPEFWKKGKKLHGRELEFNLGIHEA